MPSRKKRVNRKTATKKKKGGWSLFRFAQKGARKAGKQKRQRTTKRAKSVMSVLKLVAPQFTKKRR